MPTMLQTERLENAQKGSMKKILQHAWMTLLLWCKEKKEEIRPMRLDEGRRVGRDTTGMLKGIIAKEEVDFGV